ncbi:MAG: hypothetical protein FWC26_02230 [Fibromonadales bacterium]|nr:hypothetical protein [Fibromonadales bacterium]
MLDTKDVATDTNKTTDGSIAGIAFLIPAAPFILTGAAAVGGRRIYTYIRGDKMYLTGMPKSGKSTFKFFLENDSLISEKLKRNDGCEKFDVKGELCEKFDIKNGLDGDNILYSGTKFSPGLKEIKPENYNAEAERIKDTFVTLYFFNVKEFIEKEEYRKHIKNNMQFYANAFKSIEFELWKIFEKYKQIVDKDKIFIAVGTYLDECNESPDEMKEYMSCLKGICRYGVILGSLKSVEGAKELKENVISGLERLEKLDKNEV